MKPTSPILVGTILAVGVGILVVGTFTARKEAALRIQAMDEGRNIYDVHCAACHGAELEGQPNWKSPLPSGRLPAPPHDASGHTWHHRDDVLFRIVKDGTATIVGGGYESDMPGFGDVLSDAEIWAVLDYIKSTWPERERSYQESVSQAE